MPFPRIIYKQEALKKGHSQEYIDEIISYAQNLEDNNLPVIFSLLHFSYLVGLEYNNVKHIIKNSSNFYKVYPIRKRKGGKRQISSPYRSLKIMQQYINKFILNNVPIHENAFGFVKEKSIVHNARKHINQDCILNIDLADFFGSITEKQVYSIFLNLGYAKNLAVDFAKISTSLLEQENLLLEGIINPSSLTSQKKTTPSLPQGAPTSPILSNIRAFRLDKRFTGFANKNELVYSRYADDITFSGKMENLPKISFLKKVIHEERFKLNESKIRLYTKKSNRRFVTGLLVDKSIRLPKKYKKEIYRHIYFCKKYGPKEHIDYHNDKIGEERKYFYEWLKGKIAFVKMVEPLEAQKMFKLFNSIDWGIK